MKKLLLVFGIVGIVVGCGNKVELTTKEYKQDLIKKVFDHDEEATKKYDEITLKLKEQVNAGKEEATRELERWDDAKEDERVKRMIGSSKETEERARRYREKYGKH